MIKSVTVLAAICLLAGCASNDTSTADQGQNGVTAAASGNLSDADRQFINNATVGGMCEVQAGQIALDRATDNNLKQFGEQMVTDHTRIDTELMQLAQQKGVTPPAMLNADAQQQIDKLNSLSGDDFNSQYLQDQVKGHQDAVKLFQNEINQGQDTDVKAFASKNLPTIQHHLDMIQGIQSSTGVNSSELPNKQGPGTPNGPTNDTSTPPGNSQSGEQMH
jgi:putative membrane protein